MVGYTWILSGRPFDKIEEMSYNFTLKALKGNSI